MRQVRGDGEDLVVMRRSITSTRQPTVPRPFSRGDRGASAPGGGVSTHQRPSNSSAKLEAGPGMLGAGDRVAGDENARPPAHAARGRG